MSKKVIHRSKLRQYSSGEGYNQYIEAENRRAEAYNKRKQREAEEERARTQERIEE